MEVENLFSGNTEAKAYAVTTKANGQLRKISTPHCITDFGVLPLMVYTPKFQIPTESCLFISVVKMPLRCFGDI